MDLMSMINPVNVDEKKLKKETKHKTAKKDNKAVSNKNIHKEGDNQQTKYKYPFKIHAHSSNLDISGMFEDEKEYTGEEISKIMLEHKYYAFGGKVIWDYRKDDNVLLPIFEQHKKG